MSRKGETIYKRIGEKSFREIAQQWIIYKMPQIKESTRNKYLITLKKRLYPYLGDQSIEDITKQLVEELVNELFSAGKKGDCGFAPKTISDTLSVLNSIMQYAQDHGYKIHYQPGSVHIRQNVRRVQVLTQEEQKKLCSYLISHPDRRNVGILLSLFTGIRIGELCALKWEHISVEKESIYVCKTMQRLYYQDALLSSPADDEPKEARTYIAETTPKSSCSIRTIPVPGQLVNLLRDLEQENGYFLTGDENRYVEPRTLQHYYKKVLKINQIEQTNFHVLRHTFATRCVELGFDLKSLSEILGHANVNITMNRYVHPSMDMKRNNMSRLNELLSI